jgi:hypothetical protein
MAAHRRRTPRSATGALAVTLLLGALVAGCSWSSLEESSSAEMRPVPTVPPTSAPGEEIVVAPEVSSEPVTTDVVGDPRPDPDSDVTLPPLPDVPVVDPCTRLVDVQVAEQLGAALGTGVATVEPIGDTVCRFTAGAGVAEVHFLPETVIESEWFRRNGIEPLGDVTADSIGIAEFAAPGSDVGAGYTIALVSRRQGAVVAVRGTPDDRGVAVQLANTVESST